MLRFQPQTNRNALYLQLHPTKWPICRKWAFLKFNLSNVILLSSKLSMKNIYEHNWMCFAFRRDANDLVKEDL